MKVKLFEEYIKEEDLFSHLSDDVPVELSKEINKDVLLEGFENYMTYILEDTSEESIMNNMKDVDYIDYVEEYVKYIKNNTEIYLYEQEKKILTKILEKNPELYSLRKEWFDEHNIPARFKRASNSGLLDLKK